MHKSNKTNQAKKTGASTLVNKLPRYPKGLALIAIAVLLVTGSAYGLSRYVGREKPAPAANTQEADKPEEVKVELPPTDYSDKEQAVLRAAIGGITNPSSPAPLNTAIAMLKDKYPGSLDLPFLEYYQGRSNDNIDQQRAAIKTMRQRLGDKKALRYNFNLVSEDKIKDLEKQLSID